MEKNPTSPVLRILHYLYLPICFAMMVLEKLLIKHYPFFALLSGILLVTSVCIAVHTGKYRPVLFLFLFFIVGLFTEPAYAAYGLLGMLAIALLTPLQKLVVRMFPLKNLNND